MDGAEPWYHPPREVDASSDPGARRYRIAALLGKGTCGRIYRAVLEDSGAETDVAIKLLRDEDVAAITLARFRDEAELARQVDDRAMVRLAPPVKLTDPSGSARWAIVMDLVTGASLQRLTSLGAMPPSVAAEIVAEVARVLEKAWRATGSDGQRLRILHRDIKPNNLQLNAGGELRVLDFGIAKTDYKTRDAQVSLYGTGTRGFIAPERLEGTESPSGDIFSLGVTAHALIGGDRPRRKDNEDPVEQEMIALFGRMRSAIPAERPTALDVEELCTQLRQRSDGMTLRDWAERNVPRAIALKFSDEVVGTTLDETGASGRSRSPMSRPPSSVRWSTRPPPAPRTDGPGAAAAAKPKAKRSDDEETVVASRDSYLAGLEDEPTPLPLPPRAGPAIASQRPSPAKASRSMRSSPPESSAVTRMMRPTPAGPTEPAETHAGLRWFVGVLAIGVLVLAGGMLIGVAGGAGVWWMWPSAVVVRHTPPSLPALSTEMVAPEMDLGDLLPVVPPPRTLTFSSIPLGADVYVDRKRVGQTPVTGLFLDDGMHEVILVSDFEKLVRPIEVGKKMPVRYVWKGGDDWELHF